MSKMKNEIFLRTETNQELISVNTYNLIIGLSLIWGFFINYLIVKYIDTQLVRSVDYRVFLLAYFGLCFLGIHIFNKSTNPLYSFFGYNLVVIPFGFCLNLILAQYDPLIVLRAIQLTGAVTISMIILGSLFPSIFNNIIRPITLMLIFTLIYEIIMLLIFHKSFAIIDWIVAILFCGYIGYDWGRANAIPKTVDNAIDSAAAIYMDIINLFIRILRIMGRKKR
jgi:FtsH-binding integral membrane protein